MYIRIHDKSLNKVPLHKRGANIQRRIAASKMIGPELSRYIDCYVAKVLSSATPAEEILNNA